jgi:hypothetical protein
MSHSQRVQWQPQDRKYHGDCDEHPDDSNLGALDVTVGPAPTDSGYVPSPHPDPDHRIEDGDEEKREAVAGQEHDAEEEALLDLH